MATEEGGPALHKASRGLVAAIWLGVAVAAAGCTPARILGLQPSRPAGPLAVTLSVPLSAFTVAPGQAPPALVRVILVKDARVLTQEQPVEGLSGEGDPVYTFSFDRVYEGRWDVAGELVDTEGDTIYAGSTRLYVTAGETATVRLRLVARAATLRVQIDLTGYDRESLVTAAGVNLKGSVTATLRSSRPGQELIWQFDRERVAGTYDVQLLLYQQDGTVEFSKEYQGVVLLPGKTTRLSWRPEAGGAIVIGEVDWAPGAPTILQCRALPQERQLEVTWAAPDDGDLAGFRIYVRPPEGSLRLRAEVGAGATQALVSDQDLPWGTGGSAYVGVTAVDLAGQESLHAPAECLIPSVSA